MKAMVQGMKRPFRERPSSDRTETGCSIHLSMGVATGDGKGGGLLVLTVGHSTRPLQDFFEMLRAHGVRRIVDVRTIPRSRRNPQFNKDALGVTAPEAGFEYLHVPELGGLRRPAKDSVNAGWRNLSFEAVEQLKRNAADVLQVIMCAEAVHWRCHRSLVADALLVRGVQVEHIFSATKRQPHRITPFAQVEGTSITYPAQEGGAA
jgi:uncharacterized protein (DUF488 family)